MSLVGCWKEKKRKEKKISKFIFNDVVKYWVPQLSISTDFKSSIYIDAFFTLSKQSKRNNSKLFILQFYQGRKFKLIE